MQTVLSFRSSTSTRCTAFGACQHRVFVSPLQRGYSHFAIFAAIAATGAGIAAAADHAAGKAAISRVAAGAGVAIPSAVYLAFVWLTHVRPHIHARGPAVAFVIAIAGVLVAPFLPGAVLMVGVVQAALAAYLVLHGRSDALKSESAASTHS